ncbi:MAG: ParA family protein [Flammeovirgaceae bacterium]|nr:ParA family protein [Flammeovirgaceae bacterium]MDW8286611.1 ParA family protein [Flammeovirgaceae bacterium]
MSAKIISFANQKGGVGKSTLLLLTAAALHRRTNKKVLVIDCDPQKSIHDVYTQEGGNSEAFDVISFNWRQPKPEVNFDKTIALAEKKYDVIFLDIPGKLDGREIYFSILVSDIVIVPIVASALDIKATIDFLKTLPQIREIKEKEGFKLEVYGVINKKDQTYEHKRLKELTGIGGLQLFYSPLSNLVRYKRNISTIYDIVDPQEDDEFNRYFEEFRAKCYV